MGKWQTGGVKGNSDTTHVHIWSSTGCQVLFQNHHMYMFSNNTVSVFLSRITWRRELLQEWTEDSEGPYIPTLHWHRCVSGVVFSGGKKLVSYTFFFCLCNLGELTQSQSIWDRFHESYSIPVLPEKTHEPWPVFQAWIFSSTEQQSRRHWSFGFFCRNSLNIYSFKGCSEEKKSQQKLAASSLLHQGRDFCMSKNQ